MSIIAKTLSKSAKFRKVEMDWEGEKVVFKEPSVRVRNMIFDKASKPVGDKGDVKIDPFLFQAYTIVYCTFNEKGEQEFGEEHVEMMLDLPAGTEWFAKFAEQATKLLGADEDSKKQEG